MGTAGGFDLNRSVRTVRELAILSVLRPGPLDAESIKDDYEMQMSDLMEESSIYRVLNSLMRRRLVRYASSREIDPKVFSLELKFYTLTKEGVAEVEKVFTLMCHNEREAEAEKPAEGETEGDED